MGGESKCSVEELERKLMDLPATTSDDESYADIAEESVAELMQCLEWEIICPDAADELSYYYQSPAFVTINGDEEMCGPSFSDCSSTVMASIDTCGVAGVSFFYGVPPGKAAPGAGVWGGLPTAPLPRPPAAAEEGDEERMPRGIGGEWIEGIWS